jgi:uncharacterized protein (DUF1684 family)
MRGAQVKIAARRICPLAPAENELPIATTAGERMAA